MKSQGLETAPSEIANLQGDTAPAQFVKTFKEVQRLKTNLGQYTDLTPEQKETIDTILPNATQRSFKSQYLETAKRLKAEREDPTTPVDPIVEELDFEFVLFASATIDYDYIMQLMANFSQAAPGKEKMTRKQLIALITSDAKFSYQREEITAYIHSFEPSKGLSEELYEGVARPHLEKIGWKPSKLTEEQADYIDVPYEDPYKQAHYPY